MNIQNNIDDLPKNIKKALNNAISVLYFDDNSDYKTALYEIVTNILNTDDDFLDEKNINEIFKYLNNGN